MGTAVSRFKNNNSLTTTTTSNTSQNNNITSISRSSGSGNEQVEVELINNESSNIDDKNNNNNNNNCTIKPINISISPSRIQNLNSHIPDTPRGNDVNNYPYYCPLCMEYYKDVLRTHCCGNYVCKPCSTTFVESRGIEVGSVNDLLMLHSNDMMQSLLSCPHCGSDTFKPSLVELTDMNIRDYSDNTNSNTAPSEQGRSATGVGSSTTGTGTGTGIAGTFSPVKIGDSFEDLKRKMTYHPTHTHIKISPISPIAMILAEVEPNNTSNSNSTNNSDSNILVSEPQPEQHSPDSTVYIPDEYVLPAIQLFKHNTNNTNSTNNTNNSANSASISNHNPASR